MALIRLESLGDEVGPRLFSHLYPMVVALHTAGEVALFHTISLISSVSRADMRG